jgi:hypothetical protein
MQGSLPGGFLQAKPLGRFLFIIVVMAAKIRLRGCLDLPAARRALALKTKSDEDTPVEVTRRIARINRL